MGFRLVWGRLLAKARFGLLEGEVRWGGVGLGGRVAGRASPIVTSRRTQTDTSRATTTEQLP